MSAEAVEQRVYSAILDSHTHDAPTVAGMRDELSDRGTHLPLTKVAAIMRVLQSAGKIRNPYLQ